MDEDLKNIKAAILAGGLGSRLRSVVCDRPKVMAEIGGHPFLEYLLRKLKKTGISQVVLCTGHMGEIIRETFGDAYGRLDLYYSQEMVPLGTGGALRNALYLLDSDSVLVMNGDSYCDADLNAFWEFHQSEGANATLVLVKSADRGGRYGHVRINSKGQIVSFDEKSEHAAAGWINAGIYLLRKELILSIPEGKLVSLEKEVFQAWIGRELYGFQSDGPFIDIGIPEDYARAEQVMSPYNID
jgi:NDP-sugar pyrophosphorylase family protein